MSAKLPPLQRNYFFSMPRARAVLDKIDIETQSVTATLDNDSRQVTVAIRPDTEIYFRDATGTLDDFIPGQHVMLFMLVDEQKNWLYPRALMDDVHLDAGHKRFATVVSIDSEARTVATRREDRRKGLIEESILVADDVKVWKGGQPSGLDALKVGDEIVKQSVRRDGKLIAVELFDRTGVEAVKAVQAEAYKQHQETAGLIAYVTDVEPLNGFVVITVPGRDAPRAKELKDKAVVTITPDGQKPFAARIRTANKAGKRLRIELHCQAAAAAKLDYGQTLHLWLPGTGLESPRGKLGLPE